MAGQVIDLSSLEEMQRNIGALDTSNQTPTDVREVVTQKVVSDETSQALKQYEGTGITKRKTVKYKVIKVALPSEGKFYPKDGPIYGLKEIEVRNLTAPDEDILTSTNLIRNGKAVDKLLQSVILTEHVNPDNLLIGDRMAILVALRVNAYGEDYDPGEDEKVTCRYCANEFHQNFDLSGLAVRKTTLNSPGGNIFPVTLPSGTNITVKFFTQADENEVDAIIKASKKTRNDGVDHTASTRLWYHIYSVDGDTDRGKINQFIETLEIKDTRFIRKFINDNEPSLELKQKIMCPECTAEFVQDIPLTASFFFPAL